MCYGVNTCLLLIMHLSGRITGSGSRARICFSLHFHSRLLTQTRLNGSVCRSAILKRTFKPFGSPCFLHVGALSSLLNILRKHSLAFLSFRGSVPRVSPGTRHFQLLKSCRVNTSRVIRSRGSQNDSSVKWDNSFSIACSCRATERGL